MLNALFASFCFCDRISSNNLTNNGMFYNQSLTGELQEPVCLSERAFFQFFKPDKLFGVQRK